MEMHTYRAHNRFDNDPPPIPPPAARLYDPGHLVAISPSQNTSATGQDSGTFGPGGIFTFTGRDGLPRSISGNYANCSVPGGHTGTRVFPGKGALNQNVNGPIVTQDITGAVLTKALVIKYPWKELEPTKDPGDGSAYVLDRVFADAAACAALGTRLFVFITVRTFDPAPNPAPTYLDKLPYNIHYSLSGGGYQISRWDTFVRTRMGFLVDFIGNALDGFAGYYGIATQETACNMTTPEQNSVGYTADGYLLGLKGEVTQILSAGTRQLPFCYHNFVPTDPLGNGGDPYAESYAKYVASVGGVIGGPDLLPDSNLNPNVYNNYQKVVALSHAVGNGPCFIAAQPHTFDVMNGDGSTNGGIVRTGQEMFNFATNHGGAVTSRILHNPDITGSNLLGIWSDFIVWDWHQGGAQDFEGAVIPIMKAFPDFHFWNP